MFGYNWDGNATSETALLSAKYVAGRYGGSGNNTLSSVVNLVNQGTQSRVGIKVSGGMIIGANGTFVVCLGEDEAYFRGSQTSASALANATFLREIGGAAAGDLASAINTSSKNFWAMTQGNVVWVFAKEPGNHNDWEVQEKGDAPVALANVSFINAQTGASGSAGAKFSLGGEHWAQMNIYEPSPNQYGVVLLGRDVGSGQNLWIAGSGDAVLATLTGLAATQRLYGNLQRVSFTEIQNASDGNFIRGSHIRTQEAGQTALEAVNDAIIRKDVIRANLGSIANRLEATMENLTIQTENLQAAESRISDVDVATEMTEFTKNNILAQAATSMLAQANSLSSLALTLLR
jgi:flagellin-like hook-associated protein FlgL